VFATLAIFPPPNNPEGMIFVAKQLQ